MIYLICFDKKLSHAKHYIGCTQETDPFVRLSDHKKGKGAKILNELNKRGIAYDIVRVWPERNWKFERQLKNYKGAKRLCPVCSGSFAKDRMVGK